MKASCEIARLAVEDMSTAEAKTFLKWLQRKVPTKVEAETPTLDSAALWWLVKLKSGVVLPGMEWPKLLSVDDLGSDYIAMMKEDGMSRRGGVTTMGRFLKKVGVVEKHRTLKIEATVRAGEPGGEHLVPRTEVIRTRRRRHFVFRGLAECRAGFEAEYGKQDWGDSDDSGGTADDAQRGDSQYPDGQ